MDRARATREGGPQAGGRGTGPSADSRRALDLAYFGGHTYAEVGDLLGVSAGTAMSSIRDGLLEVREARRQDGPPSAQ